MSVNDTFHDVQAWSFEAKCKQRCLFPVDLFINSSRISFQSTSRCVVSFPPPSREVLGGIDIRSGMLYAASTRTQSQTLDNILGGVSLFVWQSSKSAGHQDASRQIPILHSFMTASQPYVSISTSSRLMSALTSSDHSPAPPPSFFTNSFSPFSSSSAPSNQNSRQRCLTA